ncbi:MAG: EamA family transporter [Rhizobiales bacterium]|nr:EamA family transporter [Hyphomicrobiales bacterium]
MHTAAIVLAIAAAVLIGLGLILAQIGLRGITPIAAAAISVPTSMLLFALATLLALALGRYPVDAQSWQALPIFAAIGLLYPATVTLLNFESSRRIGSVITGTLGNFTPVVAVALAVLVLDEPLRWAHLIGLAVIVAGVMVLTTPRGGGPAHWRSWALLLPLAGAAIRGIVQPGVKFGLEIWSNPLAAALVGYVVSSVLVFSVVRMRTGRFMPDAPRRSRLWFVAVGLVNGAALLLMYAALAGGPVALVAPLLATYPLTTLAWGALILGRPDAGARLLLGIVTTVVGVVLLVMA